MFVGMNSQCSSCTKFRITLNVMLHRFEEAREEGMSNLSNRTNFRYLNTPQKVTKLREMKESLKFQQQKVKHLKSLLDDGVRNRSTEVDSDMHSDLCTIMKENQANIADKYQNGQYTNCQLLI